MGYKVTAFDLKLALLQYFRFKRQCLCVDEFRGADIIVDTGKEIIEVETKVTKSNLIDGEKAKAAKHQAYKFGGQFAYRCPNKFMFCVPEELVEIALNWANELNEKYGVIGFDAKTFEKNINMNWDIWPSAYIRIAKSAKRLHKNYDNKLRWAIAKRTSAKIISLIQEQFKRTLIAKELAKGEAKDEQNT